MYDTWTPCIEVSTGYLFITSTKYIQYTKLETLKAVLDNYASAKFKYGIYWTLTLRVYNHICYRFISPFRWNINLFKNLILRENNSCLKEKQYSLKKLKFPIGIKKLPIHVGISISIGFDKIR